MDTFKKTGLKHSVKVVIIGAGNVAHHLGPALQRAGTDIVQVYNRSHDRAKELAQVLDCDYTSVIKEIKPGADIYFLCVADNAIGELLRVFPHKDVLVVHTSGSTPLSVFEPFPVKGGVFYPLQTFSRSVEVQWQDIPICLEVAHPGSMPLLLNIAGSMSHKVVEADTSQRNTLHLAAVFASNFTNHMYHIAADILECQNLTMELLLPLINETVRKAAHGHPALLQTGPAVRNDTTTIKRHLDQLKALPHYRKMYNFISRSILTNKKI